MELKTLSDIKSPEVFGVDCHPDGRAGCVKREDLKREAIKHIISIQNGSGVDKTTLSDNLKGGIAKEYWNDEIFCLGIEYGVVIGLMNYLNITDEEINEYNKNSVP